MITRYANLRLLLSTYYYYTYRTKYCTWTSKLVKAKFHYAILVAEVQGWSPRPVADLLARC